MESQVSKTRPGVPGARHYSIVESRQETAIVLYESWGLTRSPFETASLPSSELGDRLLVGRDSEVNSLTRKITSGTKMATLEGLNGVGKTSVVNVATYRLFNAHLNSGEEGLYIPCRKIFQLNPAQDLHAFMDQVLMEVAQTLIEKARLLTERGRGVRTKQIDRWLNAPQLNSASFGVTIGLFGVQGGGQNEINTSSGFERSGFRKTIQNLLEEVFPSEDSGGVVCTIDNLELLQSSDAARSILEQLRDELFNIRGLRWVLCGALGIIYGVAASPRLDGYLHRPIPIEELHPRFASDILTSRVDAYKSELFPLYLPIANEDFVGLYAILRGNLRNVLSYTDDYCQWIADKDLPQTQEEKRQSFKQWLAEQSEYAYESVRQELRPKALETFNSAVRLGGVFSPSDFESFGFNSIPAFRPHIRDLEAVGVVVSTQDEGDKRRKTIQITSKGWLVANHLQIREDSNGVSTGPGNTAPTN
jgi:hypothetical protein